MAQYNLTYSAVFMDEKLKPFRESINPEAKRKAAELSILLGRIFNTYPWKKEYLNNSGTPVFTLNSDILNSATIAIWEDLIRLQAYHTIDVANKYKHAAYIFKWLNKLRPVQLDEGSIKNENDEGRITKWRKFFFQVNAVYALDCACSFFNPKKMDNKMVNDIIYSAKYRDINPEQWAITFCCLSDR